MFIVFCALCFISPFLWIASIFLTKEWKQFKSFAIVNTLIFVLYIFILNFTELIDLGHDEYGLRILFMNIFLIIGHVLVGFIAGLIIKRRMKKKER